MFQVSRFKFHNEKGFAISIITFFILIIMLSIAISMSSLIFYRQRISTNIIKSNQSYYTAEAGAEDALLALRNNPSMSSKSYSLMVNNTTTAVTIPSAVGGSRIVTSDGNAGGLSRKLQVVYSVDTQKVSFNYGVQVGEGGLEMKNGSKVQGNVFSNGNIYGGNGTIGDNAIVAGNGHSIKDVNVKKNTLVYSCLSPATIDGNLTYVTGGTRTCMVQGSILTQSNEISPQPLPISDNQIDNWKTGAANGGVISGNLNLNNGETQSRGPVKITGNLKVSNNSTLNITGTIYVVGNMEFDNGSIIKLDSSYGSLSGVVLSDGNVTVSNNSTFFGSGQTGSYPLVLSTSSSGSAIVIGNNAAGAIFYTSSGAIQVSNNVVVKELTGYKIKLDNNAEVQYESGLANLLFSSGPGGGWKVTSWEEK